MIHHRLDSRDPVDPVDPVDPRDSVDPRLGPLLELLHGRRVVVLAGAGCSTESGIPDYRGPDGRMRARTPIQYQAFVRDSGVRARYWARSAVGWPRFTAAPANAAHRALARLEAAGLVRGVITQNVDGLHHAAGSRRVVELHGSLAAVRCLECDAVTDRDAMQRRLLALNPRWTGPLGVEPAEAASEPASEPASPSADRRVAAARTAPDGDVELPEDLVAGFRVPECEACGGVLKPDVVFFGENVPRRVVDGAWALFEEAEVLLVVGSSLTVYSGRRFTDRAAREGLPVGIVNQGVTRADASAAVKVEARAGRVLPRVAEALLA